MKIAATQKTVACIPPRVYRAAGWKIQRRARGAFGVMGKKATIALTSTVVENSDDVIDRIAAQIHAPHDASAHLTCKFVLAFLAALVAAP